MTAPSGFPVRCQVCSAKFSDPACLELQHLPSLVTSGIFPQLAAHPSPRLIFFQAWWSLAQLMHGLVFGKTQRTPIYSFLEPFLCTARSSAICCPEKSSHLGSPELQPVSSIRWVFCFLLGLHWALLQFRRKPGLMWNPFLKDYIPTLCITRCLKTVGSCILSSLKVVFGRRVSLTPLTPSWL